MKKNNSIEIISAAFHLPETEISVQNVYAIEGLVYDPADEIGIERLRVFEGAWKFDLALEAAKKALAQAGLEAVDLDVIVDFSVMPQDYVVPSWCMSNKIQADLGAKNAFNLGFGGGATTNLITALKFVVALIRSGQVKTALLVASDVAIPGNRVINPEEPATILGDGASALIVGNSAGFCEIVDIELWSDGNNHDALCVPGGGLANPERPDLYQLRIDYKKYSVSQAFGILKSMCEKLVKRNSLELQDIQSFVFPNISIREQNFFSDTFSVRAKDPFALNRCKYGHIQATDIVINLAQLGNERKNSARKPGMVCSHGWGFLSGAMLVNV